ncbi:MAG: S-adenosylmethionine synthetase [Candidatus Nitrosothermus koennekii]|nr:MAG: S-adenosylmethionine synthetase [Candidatus Nitrosothermus koennekii]
MRNIHIEALNAVPTFKRRFEIVERKGLGHPDTICDLVMDEISVAVAKMYMKEVGYILHYNLDKALLVAGESVNRFNGGEIIKPMRLVIGDRASFSVNDHILPINDIIEKTAKRWFNDNLRFVKDEHIRYQIELGKAASELRSIFTDRYRSNDTSALVGYAPLTKTEEAVLRTEEYINSKEFKSEFPESGEDVKVMGFRDNDSLELVLAIAFIDSYIDSVKHYFNRKKEMLQAIEEFHRKKGYFDKFNIIINNLDKESKGIDGLYLTVLGTSADSSDSGEVGRGNRVNGVTSLMRPTGSEAAAGKNPVTHIGKIYNALAFKIANDIYQNIDLDEVFVWLYNIIGNTIDEPVIIIQSTDTSEEIEDIVEDNLSKIDEFCKELISGNIKIV